MKKLYVITGATGGMGYEAAKRFSKEGKLLLLDVSLDKLESVKKEIGGDIDIMLFDITNKDHIKNVGKYIEKNKGFDYLIHFAGVSESVGNSELIYNINLIGSANLLNELYDHIRPGGVIINTSSMTGHMTPATPDAIELLNNPLDEHFLDKIIPLTGAPTVAYGWSKLGLMNLTVNEATKWGKKQARIISISPGAIKTPMVELEMKKNSEAINQLISATPVNRIGESEDIVNLVEFLISDKASFISGTDILIDGGVTEVFKKMY